MNSSCEDCFLGGEKCGGFSELTRRYIFLFNE